MLSTQYPNANAYTPQMFFSLFWEVSGLLGHKAEAFDQRHDNPPRDKRLTILRKLADGWGYKLPLSQLCDTDFLLQRKPGALSRSVADITHFATALLEKHKLAHSDWAFQPMSAPTLSLDVSAKTYKHTSMHLREEDHIHCLTSAWLALTRWREAIATLIEIPSGYLACDPLTEKLLRQQKALYPVLWASALETDQQLGSFLFPDATPVPFSATYPSLADLDEQDIEFF